MYHKKSIARIIVYFVFFSLFTCVSFSMKKGRKAKSKEKVKKIKNIIDVAVFLNYRESDEKIYRSSEYYGGYGSHRPSDAPKPGPILRSLKAALDSNIDVIVANSKLVKSLANYTYVPKDIATYKTPDKEFAIFIAKKSEKINLDNYDLNPQLIPIKTLNEFTKKSSTITMKTFTTIFQDKPNNKKKIIYLGGHGIPESFLSGCKIPGYIAQLETDQYADFIKHLGKINCLFLFVNSCYASGGNIEKVLSKLAAGAQKTYKEVDEKDISFPIALGVLPDMPALYVEPQFRKFFDGLCAFFARTEQQVLEITGAPTLKKIIQYIMGKHLENSALVRFPKLRTFFRPVDIDKNILMITYPFLIARELSRVQRRKRTEQEVAELEKFYRKDGGKEKKIKEIKTKRTSVPMPIEIGAKEAVFLYPTVLESPLIIERGKIPALVSMFSGKTHHFIRRIDAKNKNIITLIQDMFCQFEIGYRKLFFVGDIYLKDSHVRSFCLRMTPDIDAEAIIIEVNAEIDGILKMSKFNVSFKDISTKLIARGKRSKISPIIFTQDFTYTVPMLLQYIAQFAPSENAYIEATGGIENEIVFARAIDSHFDLKLGRVVAQLGRSNNRFTVILEKAKKTITCNKAVAGKIMETQLNNGDLVLIFTYEGIYYIVDKKKKK